MTYNQRNSIILSEVLTISDLCILSDKKLSYQQAAKIMRDIKQHSDRLQIQGKIHIQDYIDYYHLDIARYIGVNHEQQDDAV